MIKLTLIKKKNAFFFLINSFFCSLISQNSFTSESIEKFTKCIKRDFTYSDKISLELALLFLQQGYEICTLIDKIDPQISSQLGVQCGSCKNKILSYAEFAGSLVASNLQDQYDTFKKLLSNPEAQKINLFIMKVANEQQIKCSNCEKFGHWIKIN